SAQSQPNEWLRARARGNRSPCQFVSRVQRQRGQRQVRRRQPKFQFRRGAALRSLRFQFLLARLFAVGRNRTGGVGFTRVSNHDRHHGDHLREQDAQLGLPTAVIEQPRRTRARSFTLGRGGERPKYTCRSFERSAHGRRDVEQHAHDRDQRRLTNLRRQHARTRANRGAFARHLARVCDRKIIMDYSRRRFIRQAACAAVGTTSIASTVWNLRAINAATAQALGSTSDFRSLVCLFLYGGNDANNMVVPNDDTSYQAYAAARGPLALAQSSLLPLSLTTPDPQGRTFALHPSMPELQSLFNNDKSLGIIANVGTLIEPTTAAQYLNHTAKLPPQLFSH